MKSKLHSSLIVLAMPALFILASELSTARAQGTAFIYQGQLNNDGSVANGLYDFQFSLYTNADGSGTQSGSTVTQTNIGVTNGLFTIGLNFGDVFTGEAIWLAISTRSNATGSYTDLTPLQPLAPVPYAIFANTASNLSGSVASANVSGVYSNAVTLSNGANKFSGTFTGDGTNLTSLNASNLSLGTVPLARLGGITSNQLDPATWQLATNLNGGNAVLASNVVSGIAITNPVISYALITNSVFSGNGGGLTNLNASQLSSGVIPLARLPATVVTNLDGGNAALASNVVSGIAITNPVISYALITNSVFAGNGGGLTNLNASQLSSGVIPLALLPATVVTNLNGGDAALASNVVSGIAITNPVVSYALITNSVFAGNGGGLTNLSASQLSSGVIPLERLPATVVTNLNGGDAALASNVVSGIAITNARVTYASITNSVFAGNGGGLTNLNAVQLTSMGNTNGGSNNFFVGLSGNPITTGSYNTGNGFQALFTNTSGSSNTANGAFALFNNTIGSYNTAAGVSALSTSTSGSSNTANGALALFHNTIGSYNTANGSLALFHNTTGSRNTAEGVFALATNTSGSNNIALGYQAGIAITTGSSNIDIGNPGVAGDDSTIRIGAFQTSTYLIGTVYVDGINLSSDRNVKENFSPVDERAVLDKVASLPVTEWNYKKDSKALRHIGPMAQDFQAAFGLDGADDKHISVVDETGVALAAIQGLNRKLNEKDVEIEKLKDKADKVDSLEKQLNELKLMVQSLAEEK